MNSGPDTEGGETEQHQEGSASPLPRQAVKSNEHEQDTSAHQKQPEPKAKWRDWWRSLWRGWSLNKQLDIFDAAVTVIAIFSTYFLIDQARQTRQSIRISAEANALAKKSYDLSQRAWLSAKISPKSPLNISLGNARMEIEVELKNTGQLVATEVQVAAILRDDLMPIVPFPNLNQMHECRSSMGTTDVFFPIPSGMVFPGESAQLTVSVNVHDWRLRTKTPIAKVGFFPSVLTCITYRSPGLSELGETRYFHSALRETESNREMSQFDKASLGDFPVVLKAVPRGQSAK